jgi:hypothetical protein
MVPQDFDDRRALHLAGRAQPREHRRFQDADPDVEADRDQDDARQERDAPAPGEKVRVRGHARHERQRAVGQHHAGRCAELRPARHEPAVSAITPFGRQQDRSAPLAADADALQHPAERQQNRAPDPNRLVAGHQADRRRPEPHQEKRGDERRFAADPIAEVTEDDRTEGAGCESHEVRREGQQHADKGIGLGEEHLREDEDRGHAIQEEVVPLDGGPDRGGHDGPPQLLTSGGFVQHDLGIRSSGDVWHVRAGRTITHGLGQLLVFR